MSTITIAHGKVSKKPVSLLFFDLDHFKQCNDTHGHQTGDRVLCAAVEGIMASTVDGDVVGRVGGDEFVVCLEDFGEAGNAAAAAQKLLLVLSEKYAIGNSEVFATPSIGIALYPTHGTKGSTLLVRAENAMRDGRRDNQRFAVHVAGRHHDQDKGRPLVEEFKHALNDGDRQLFMTFQPKINMRNQQIHGVEALVRWFHPQKGELRPDEFIPVAEETGVIVTLGNWITAQAARAAVMTEAKAIFADAEHMRTFRGFRAEGARAGGRRVGGRLP